MLFLSTPSARRATLLLKRTMSSCRNFYPRPPRGGRHHQPVTSGIPDSISIHALREEGDLSRTSSRTSTLYFYPRPPRGGRRNTSYQRAMADIFLSTPSARRATLADYLGLPTKVISIHALREEGDLGNTAALSVTTIFLSTPSARRATGYLS